MLKSVQSLGLLGIDPFTVTVEVDLSRSIPAFDIVGLPDAAVRESRERVRSAIQSCGYPYPDGRITVNLAPADIKKTGSLYDLPIFVGILAAQGLIQFDGGAAVFIGELSLSGELRSASGVLPMLLGAAELGVKRAFIPAANAAEASIVSGMEVYSVHTADELVAFLRGNGELALASTVKYADVPQPSCPDFCEVKGQRIAKRALEIAAAGGHNVLLLGPPGTGKSMLAKRLPSILPEMTMLEAIETTKVYSASGQLRPGVPLINVRPFRSPHHTISSAGLCGGGAVPRPGELSLAHNGVLFLDELPEFHRDAMEALRQPLENGSLTIARAGIRLTYPGRVMLVAAMNPCPCGYFGHPTRRCTCSPAKVSAYLGRVSGPLLGRIDLHVDVPPVSYEQLSSVGGEECSADIKRRVCAARAVQNARFAGTDIICNAGIPPAMLSEVCVLDDKAQKLLKNVFEKLSLSGRAYDRILKVSRTIADLDNCEIIHFEHISEAVQYRSLDRKYWAGGDVKTAE